MPINFIPNDPLAVASLPIRSKKPRPDRPSGVAGFNVQNPAREGLFEPGTPEFLFWQCREAALMALETWETLVGPLAEWAIIATNRKLLPVFPNNGSQLNAFYDRRSLQFFEGRANGKSTFSGASTDVVTHETGHALLDAVRPELMDFHLPETNAFHEACGDCMALLTALSDPDTRAAVLTTTPNLGTASFLEALMEDLADGVKRSFGSSHPSSQPRHALNNFVWQLPTTLPTSGSPKVLTGEEHSFSRVFTGCFYDTVRNIFLSAPNHTADALRTAAQTAGKLLIAGARKAPAVARFFQAVGRAMVLEDKAVNGGAHRAAIEDAFQRHGIKLGSEAMTSPRAALAGRAPRIEAAAGAVLSPATKKDLRARLGVQPGSRMLIETLELGTERLAKAVHHRKVPLTGLAEELKGVVAMAPEPVLIGAMGTRAALFSAIPEAATTEDEVKSYVSTLLAANRIDLTKTRGAAGRRSAIAGGEPSELPTHEIQTRGDSKVLVRVRFLCRGH